MHADKESGLATLTMVIIMLIAITSLSLLIARTTAGQQQLANKQQQALGADMAAEAGLEQAIAALGSDAVDWLPVHADLEVGTPARLPAAIPAPDGDRYGINIRYERDPSRPRIVRIHADTQASRTPAIHAMVEQTVRPYTVLSEAAESAPPLIVNGCLGHAAGRPHLYPRDADQPGAGRSLMRNRQPCPAQPPLALHQGSVAIAALPADLWEAVFAVTRRDLEQLAEAHRQQRAPSRRRYWWAQQGDLLQGKWHRSLGSPLAPVVLIFPRHLGCPDWMPGTQIHGVVFIDGACHGPAWPSLSIHGLLAVNGDLDRLGDFHRLAHIERAAGHPRQLHLPTYEVVRIPGTWRDFR